MYPLGHARNSSDTLRELLSHKFQAFVSKGTSDADAIRRQLTNLRELSPEDVRRLYDFEINF